jgi:hypothetical protein
MSDKTITVKVVDWHQYGSCETMMPGDLSQLIDTLIMVREKLPYDAISTDVELVTYDDYDEDFAGLVISYERPENNVEKRNRVILEKETSSRNEAKAKHQITLLKKMYPHLMNK